MIIRQFRILIQVKKIADQNSFMNYALAGKELSLHPFVVQKSIPQAKQYTLDKLKQIYYNLMEVDLKLKSSKLSAESLFNLFIVK